jgi:CRISPR/Cas system-associated endonuclease Cas1
MNADNTIYTRIKNGVIVISGTGSAIRIDENRLVIRDGPQETPLLSLTRAEARRRLRHIIVCSDAGGYINFDALRWLRDTGVAFSQLDWNGTVIATSPSVPDVPALRRAQTLTCSGVIPNAMGAIVREIRAVKLTGQARVARLLHSVEGIGSKQSVAASSAIGGFATAVRREADIDRMLLFEAQAAALYWQLWKTCRSGSRGATRSASGRADTGSRAGSIHGCCSVPGLRYGPDNPTGHQRREMRS